MPAYTRLEEREVMKTSFHLYPTQAERTTTSHQELRRISRNTGPPQGLHRGRLHRPLEGALPLLRRGRPYARHGLHRRRKKHRPGLLAAQQARVHVQRHLAAGRKESGRRVPVAGARFMRGRRETHGRRGPRGESARETDRAGL